MRTNIVLDDRLVKEAFKYTQVKTKKDLVNLSLREFVNRHARQNINALFGTVSIDANYDYKDAREKE